MSLLLESITITQNASVLLKSCKFLLPWGHKTLQEVAWASLPAIMGWGTLSVLQSSALHSKFAPYVIYTWGNMSHLYMHGRPYQHHCICQSTMFTLQILNWHHRNAHKQNNQSCAYSKREIKSRPPPCHSKSSNNNKNSIHHSIIYKGKYCLVVWWWQQNNTPSHWKMIIHIKFQLKHKSLTYWWKINVKPVQNPILHFHIGQEKNAPSRSLFSVCPLLEAR